MTKFKITIYKWKEILHERNYQFETESEANAFKLGLFQGFVVTGHGPTGFKCILADEKNIEDENAERHKAYVIIDEAIKQADDLIKKNINLLEALHWLKKVEPLVEKYKHKQATFCELKNLLAKKI